MEDILIRKIKGGINAINGGRKSPKEAELGSSLNRLKGINEPMYEDLIAQYKDAVTKYNEQN